MGVCGSEVERDNCSSVGLCVVELAVVVGFSVVVVVGVGVVVVSEPTNEITGLGRGITDTGAFVLVESSRAN